MNRIRLKICIIIGILLFLLVGMVVILKGIIFPRRYKGIVENAARLYSVDPNLIYAVMKQESNFYEKATSKSGAKGLMQLMETTATEIASEIPSIDQDDYDIYDPYTSINIGTKYMARLLSYFDGNYYLALAAYNAGLGRVSSWFEKPYNEYDNIYEVIEKLEYNETKNYLEKVIRNYSWYVMLY